MNTWFGAWSNDGCVKENIWNTIGWGSIKKRLDKYEVSLRMMSRLFKVILLLFMVAPVIVVLYDVLAAPKVLTRENK